MNEKVIAAIENERAYQEKRWPGHRHTVGEWLLIMDKCLNDAKRCWVTGHGDDTALHEIRQVVATGVAAMEQCGAPLRKQVPARNFRSDLPAGVKDYFVYSAHSRSIGMDGMSLATPSLDEGPGLGMFTGTEAEVRRYCELATMDAMHRDPNDRVCYRPAHWLEPYVVSADALNPPAKQEVAYQHYVSYVVKTFESAAHLLGGSASNTHVCAIMERITFMLNRLWFVQHRRIEEMCPPSLIDGYRVLVGEFWNKVSEELVTQKKLYSFEAVYGVEVNPPGERGNVHISFQANNSVQFFTLKLDVKHENV